MCISSTRRNIMHKLKKQEHKISMWVTNVIVSESRKALENRSSRREESLNWHWGLDSTYHRFAGTTSVPQTLTTYQSSKSLHTLESSTNCAMARTKTGKSMICGEKKKNLHVNSLKLYLLADISSLNITLPLNNIYLPVDQHHSLLRTVEE